jgi:predicted HAD superfamily phosphohydrolase YqeG
VASVADLSPEWFARRGIRAVVWDVDGTLTSYHGSEIGAAMERSFSQLLASHEQVHAILSNCDETRFAELGRIFPHTMLLRGYENPNSTNSSFRIRHRIGSVDSFSSAELRTTLESGARQVRKPDGRLLRESIHLLGVEDLSTVAMVGDQYLTDIATANLAGAQSVKVRTYASDSFPLTLRISQLLERLLHRLLRSLSKQ